MTKAYTDFRSPGGRSSEVQAGQPSAFESFCIASLAGDRDSFTRR